MKWDIIKWKIKEPEGPYGRKYGFLICRDDVCAYPTFDHLWEYPYVLVKSILAIIKFDK